MTYEDRHAALSESRAAGQARTRAWLLATLDPPALWQMAADLGARLPLDPAPTVERIAAALARRAED